MSLSSSRLLDIIVYGASGFTGKLVAKHIFNNQPAGLKWAIAGRSAEKLTVLISELASLTDSKASSSLPSSLIADVTDRASLENIFSQAKLVLNCAGPFRFLGRPIVEACLSVGSDYMDICGEPQFIEEIFLHYHQEAVNKGVLILHSCAFDSVPADLGCLFTMRQYQPNCCNSIESFLTLEVGKEGACGNYATYECAVHGFGDKESLKKTREDIVTTFHPPKLDFNGPKLPRKNGFYFENRLKKYAFPFMGADASVVRSSQRYLAMSMGQLVWPQYSAYATVQSWGWMALTAVYGTVFQTLASFQAGRSLLLQYPEAFTHGMFSHRGPTDQQLANTSFSMRFYSTGFSSSRELHLNNVVDSKTLKPDKEVEVLITGAEPGYVATPAIFFALALTLLEERKKNMPSGGVLTPAAAFYNSNQIYQKLETAGLHFQVIGEILAEETSNLRSKI